ncbi:hypothetical protein GCM10010195_54040 [Kitasatospora griseola]|nr:hypothetical protein GCM10010195_54040 [Kitasatospora griseola]
MSTVVQLPPRCRVVPLPSPPGAVDLWGVAVEGDGGCLVPGPDGEPLAFHSFTEATRWVASLAEPWRPREGRAAHDQRSGQDVRVMAIHECGVFVRRVRDGREGVTSLDDLSPPQRIAPPR